MAKKARRRRSDSPFRPLDELAQPIISPPPEPKTVSSEQFREEYGYVIRDLRRVFVLAAVMFTLLIVLNLVLR